MIADGAAPIAHVLRDGFVESVHHGHVVALAPDGVTAVAVGDPEVTFLPRSALKPLQAVAMLRSGLSLDGELLALACASHGGEEAHLAGVRRILGGAALSVADLRNTPGLPLDPDAVVAWRSARHGPEPLAQNCSGKHAAMLATCVRAGWPTESYLDPAHPLQRAVRETVRDLTGVVPAHSGVDGCGAPLFSSTLIGTARAFARLASAPADTPEGRVGVAMREHPWFVGGSARDATLLARSFPGLIAKDGAEGVLAAALPDGRAAVVKVLDGSIRPAHAVTAAALRAVGADVPIPPAAVPLL